MLKYVISALEFTIKESNAAGDTLLVPWSQPVSDGAVKKRNVKSPYSHSFLFSSKQKNRFLYEIFFKLIFLRISLSFFLPRSFKIDLETSRKEKTQKENVSTAFL
jgi:hypothetical protein